MEKYAVAEFDALDCSSPERALLAGILDRAYRDLHPGTEQHFRRSAVAWFLAHGATLEKSSQFTFDQCIEGLSLSASQVKFLLDQAKRSDKYEQLRTDARKAPENRQEIEEKRKDEGERMGQLFKRTRRCLGQKNPTVQWGGTVRRSNSRGTPVVSP